MVPGLGPVKLQALLAVFETPQRILAAGRNALRAVSGIGPDTAEAIANWESQVDLAGEIARIEAFGAKIIHWESPEYPQTLRNIQNPPIVLYVWGELQPEDTQAIGVVGSRNVTHYGVESAKKLSYQLAYAGYTVISGLARGIDTAAHQGALAAKGRTVAVIGSGLSRLYPPENQGLAERIATSGAVVSEYPMERSADRQTFPYRNRIVAGWGRGLLVVEAGLNSGALITANQAIDQGRPVYAVPGQIDRPTSAGSNRLIQQGARLVLSADDIFDDLGSLFPGTKSQLSNAPAHRSGETENTAPAKSAAVSSTSTQAPAKLSHEETLIVTALEAGDLSLDELSAATRLPVYKISSTLTMLELKRLVKALPGQRFAKRDQAA